MADLGLRLFLQLTVILLACRLVGMLGRRLGQPQVVCEMIAGALLGPSLLGMLAPALGDAVFPRLTADGGVHPSMAVLSALGQVGVAIYMFLVGIEFDTRLLTEHRKGAGAVSLAGIAVPFAAGALLAVPLHARGDLFTAQLGLTEAAIYLGSAMSITAFPMLARILYERGIIRTKLGSMALAAGAFNDAIAWCLLAFTIGAVQRDATLGLIAVTGGLAFFALMVLVAKPLLARALAANETRGVPLGKAGFALLLAALTASAWVAELIGIHAVFGAFTFGLIVPSGTVAREVRARIEPLTESLLLPVFFTFSGLNTSLQLVHGTTLWAIAFAVVGVATLGKGAGCALAARWSGMGWRESGAIGALMNARGLMELVILNLGLQHGIITPTLFAIMVVMAIVTTVLCSPLFGLCGLRNAPSTELGTVGSESGH